ncbi:hypothetical protein MHU86_11248 [Fragilaria crotonensis]|nr:hypothetical protein MHU86_11248 [Fragilaria crotonensis]
MLQGLNRSLAALALLSSNQFKECLKVIKAVATLQGLPFPIPNLPLHEQYEMMKTFLDFVVEKASIAVVAHCEGLLENGAMSIETYRQVQTVAGDSFKFIAEKARANTNWKAHMVPVRRHNGTPIWVKSTYEAYYEV